MNRLGWLVLTVFLSVAAFTIFSWHAEGPKLPVPALPTGLPLSLPKDVLIIPVQGVAPNQLVDTWGQSRDGGARVHQAIDIPAVIGTPVVAGMSGNVEKLFVSKLGGLTAYIRSSDGHWLTYYAHLSGYAAGLHEREQIAAGQVIAYVGDTGNAGSGNTHLHFALHRMAPGERWYQGTPINPYPLLCRC